MASLVPTHALGTRCLHHDRAVVAIDDRFVTLPSVAEPVRHPYGPAVGVRCVPAVRAIGYPVEIPGAGCGSRTVAVVVGRHGPAQIVDPTRAAPLTITAEHSPLVDIGRRALGLETPAEPTPPIVMLDAIWIDRTLRATVEAALGWPPPWSVIGALHPLAGTPIEPRLLCDRRRALRVGWAGFRQRAQAADSPWPDLAPSIAAWLDDGSFARWVLADLPPTRALLDDLSELLAAETMIEIDEALAGPVG